MDLECIIIINLDFSAQNCYNIKVETREERCAMKIFSFSELCYSNFDFDIIDIFPEIWLHGKEFSLYKNKARPCSALFFVCSDLEVSFFLSDGTPEITVKNGDVVFIPKGICYYVRVAGECGKKIDTYTVNLHFFDEDRVEFLLKERISLLTGFRDNRHEIRLKKLCDAFHRERRNSAKIKGEFFLLLDLMETSASKNDGFFYSIRKGAEAFCEEWNKNEKIEKYALMSGVSVTYFYRCFRKWSGKSPVEYRNMLRLSNAESLLRSTDMKIQKISETIGFDDPFYFCRLFREVYGLSPKHYRKYYQST